MNAAQTRTRKIPYLLSMESFGLRDTVVDPLQSLLLQASPLAQQLSSITSICSSLHDEVTSAHQCVNESGPEFDACTLAQRRSFLEQLLGALTALQESQELCRDIESSCSTAKGSYYIVNRIILAVRANASALVHLETISSGPFSGSSVVCSARAHHRLQVNMLLEHVRLAPGTCIKVCEGPSILMDNDCCQLQKLQDALLECASSHVHVLADAVADTMAQLFTDDVFKESMCIKQENTSSGILLRASLASSSLPAIRLSSFSDSLSCIASAVCSLMPSSAADAELSLSTKAVANIAQRACHKLCIFAADCAGDISQAQAWSAALQQLPPHAAVNSAPDAAFWELWSDRRSVDAVSATQQQLLQINTDGSVRQCRNVTECVTAIARLDFVSHLLLRYLPEQDAGMNWDAMHLAIPDVQGTLCMLDISRLVLNIGSELASSIGCNAHLEALATRKLSRAVCTISRIALVARTANSAPATPESPQPHNNYFEDRLLLSNDFRVLSVVLSRVAVQLSRSIVAARQQAQAKDILCDFCLLSRSASMKAREYSAAVSSHLCNAAASCLERFDYVIIASIAESHV
jgi:hypothetical protein